MKTPTADRKDQSDDKQQEWGRSRHEGFRKFNHGFQQAAPMFFTQDHHPLWLGDNFRGRSAFLIAGGKSFSLLDHGPLAQPGVLTMGINNSPRTFRPNLWCSVDDPSHWVKSIWLDPIIQKFVPISHANKKIFDNDSWKFLDLKVGDCPNVVFFKRNEHFQPNQYLWEDCINWGNHKDYGGGRSVLLAAVRILFILGVRRLYLLGVDLEMSPDQTYHFAQRRHSGSVKGNNSTYQKLKEWFKVLRPKFEKEGFQVFNCNPNSQLKAFDFIPYEDAIRDCASEMGFIDYAHERTLNLYDTEVREKEEGTGSDLNWFRTDPPKGLHKCKFCGKRCARASGLENEPGKVQLVLGCEHSRKALWKRVKGGFFGDRGLISTRMAIESEVVAEWNNRFGKGK